MVNRNYLTVQFVKLIISLDITGHLRIPYAHMAKEPLTSNQQGVLDFIKAGMAEGTGAPSYREIQRHFGYKAVGSVQDHVRALIRKGYLENSRKRRRTRGLMPSGFKRPAAKRIPIYGEIAAGNLRDNPQVELGGLTLALDTAKDPCFALRVVGNSMVDAGIVEGDFVIVEKNADIRSGDIVAALLDGETTVKRYKKKQGKILLCPENSSMSPIEVAGRTLILQGKVVALHRKD